MKGITPPEEMLKEPRWVLWKFEERGGPKPAKMPYQTNGDPANHSDPATWTTYAEVCKAAASGRYNGIGFAFGDGWAGVDLDKVIAADGQMKPWAEDVVNRFNSYTEISPSGEGVKIFVKGEFEGSGKNKKLDDGSAVEIYCRKRYFTVTGNHFGGTPHEVRDRDSELKQQYSRFFGTGMERIDDTYENMKRRLLQMDDSVANNAGHNKLFAAACEIWRWGFDFDTGLELFRFYNAEKGFPPEGEDQVIHKWKQAKDEVEAEFAAKGEPMPTKPRTLRVPFNLELTPDRLFAAKDYAQNFLVEKLIVAGEPLILGGPSKTLKTSILVDIAISVASGVPALGHFVVPKDGGSPVIVVSGESGGATLQKTAERIRKARGVGVSDNLYWGLRLPNLSIREHLDVLKMEVERTGAQMVAIDPAYLSLLAGGDEDAAKNVFRMGIILNGFGEIGKQTGTTLVLVHHFNKQIKQGQAPALSHLSQSGFSEWARQWILLNHNKPYARGSVELAVNVGGSAGHGGRYLWGVEQGQQIVGSVGWTDWDVKVEDLDAPDFSEPPKDDLMAKRKERVCQGVEWGESYTASALREIAKLGTGDDDAAAWVELEQYLTTSGVVEKTLDNPRKNGNDTGIRYVGLLA